MTFQETLDAHLQAIREKNLEAFLPTVAHDDKLSLILPNGQFITGYDEVENFHRDWFSDPDWQLDAEIVRTVEGSDMGFALLFVNYSDLDPAGQPYAKQYYLSLLFSKHGGHWQLVHDQNTFTS